jgi:hypothetical protein
MSWFDEAFWNIGKHCRIEVRCEPALQPEDAGAEVANWVPEVWEIGPPTHAGAKTLPARITSAQLGQPELYPRSQTALL